MSWTITLGGHSTGDEGEAEELFDLFRMLVEEADLTDLGVTSGKASTNMGELTLEEVRKELAEIDEETSAERAVEES